MDLSRKAQRARKHISRFISKPFTGANKGNLRALDPIVQKLVLGQKVSTLPITTLRFGQFDFTWLQMLDDDEIVELCGEWAACFQTSERSRLGSRFAQTVDLGTRRKLLGTGDKNFWNALQDVKKRYKAIAEERTSSFFKKMKTWFRTKKAKVGDWSTQNRYFGPYLTGYQTLNAVFDDATQRGAQTDVDRKILAAGGLWRVVKTGLSTGKSIVKMVLAPNPKTLVSVVKGGVKILNQLGGLLAGLTDLVRNKEADFRRLSAQLGFDQEITHLRKKYLGAGVIEDGDTLRLQMKEGPQRLEKAATITLVDLNKLREDFRRAKWWCEVWRKDIEEIQKDIDESDVVKHLNQIFGQIASEDALVKPSHVAELRGYIEPDRKAMGEKVKALEAKVKTFESMIAPRLKLLDELLAAYDTRRSLSGQQKRSAGIGLAYDVKHKLAYEVVGFDRSTLRSHTLPRKGQREQVKEGSDSLMENLRTALARRRAYLAPDDDEDEDDEDWM
jgi:hypothetical protein